MYFRREILDGIGLTVSWTYLNLLLLEVFHSDKNVRILLLLFALSLNIYIYTLLYKHNWRILQVVLKLHEYINAETLVFTGYESYFH